MKRRSSARRKLSIKPAPKRSPSRTNVKLPGQHPRIGLEATVEHVVQREHTIQAVNPDLPPVFSTPHMIGLMEHATVRAIHDELPPGTISVGTRIEVDHLKAVPPGAAVQAWARFVKYKGRFLVFDVEARSGEHVIGRGRVFRAIVEPRTHGEKAQARLQQ